MSDTPKRYVTFEVERRIAKRGEVYVPNEADFATECGVHETAWDVDVLLRRFDTSAPADDATKARDTYMSDLLTIQREHLAMMRESNRIAALRLRVEAMRAMNEISRREGPPHESTAFDAILSKLDEGAQ